MRLALQSLYNSSGEDQLLIFSSYCNQVSAILNTMLKNGL